jgi:ribose-phosphate pyrophosphokinase
MHVIGDVEGRTALIADDLVDTAGTLAKAAKALVDKGAIKVLACCTHAVLSGNAINTITESKLETVLVTDTIPLSPEAVESGRFRVLSLVSLLGEAIKRINENSSVTSLFV